MSTEALTGGYGENTICRCGAAKSYHPKPDHEYEPRYYCNVPEHAEYARSAPPEGLPAHEYLLMREHAKEAIEGGYRRVDVAPADLIALLDALAASTRPKP